MWVHAQEDDLCSSHLLGNAGHARLFAFSQVSSVVVFVEFSADDESRCGSPYLVWPLQCACPHGFHAEIIAHEEVCAEVSIDESRPLQFDARGMPRGLPVALSADFDTVQVDAGEPHGDAGAAEVCAFIVYIFPMVFEMIGSAEVSRAGSALILPVVFMFGEHMSMEVVAPVVARVALCAGMWPL